MTNAAIIKANGKGLRLATLDDFWRFAKAVSTSGLAPAGLDTPEKVLIALQTGAEVGLSPMQALRSIAVINRMPTIYGDAGLGLVRNSGLLESIEERIEGKFGTDLTKTPDTTAATCVVKRKGDPIPVERGFCVAEARLAGLWCKKGPWQSHPQRMLKYKARAFALRDAFPDVLMGLHLFEEIQGEPEYVESTPVECKSNVLLTEGTDAEPEQSHAHGESDEGSGTELHTEPDGDNQDGDRGESQVEGPEWNG